MAALAITGRPERAERTAASAAARGVQLLVFTLTRAADAGVPRKRLAEIVGGDAALVDDLLARGPEPSVVAHLAPDGVDP